MTSTCLVTPALRVDNSRLVGGAFIGGEEGLKADGKVPK
jgi:hypothetical protein